MMVLLVLLLLLVLLVLLLMLLLMPSGQTAKAVRQITSDVSERR